MSDMPSWIPPQAPTYTSNCTVRSDEMSDIVERLQDRNAVVLSGLFHAIPTMNEAADEIVRLRNKLAKSDEELRRADIDEAKLVVLIVNVMLQYSPLFPKTEMARYIVAALREAGALK